MILIIILLILIVWAVWNLGLLHKPEHFYSSGSSIRYLSESETAGEKDLDTNDFHNKELQYYLRR